MSSLKPDVIAQSDDIRKKNKPNEKKPDISHLFPPFRTGNGFLQIAMRMLKIPDKKKEKSFFFLQQKLYFCGRF